MSSIDDPSRFKKIYVIPSTAKAVKAYPGKVMMGVPNNGQIIILATPKTEPPKSIDCNNTADSTRKITAIDMSKFQLLRDPPTKPSDNGNKPIGYIEHKNDTSEKASTEVVWLPTASQNGEKSLTLENENIELLHSERESDEDRTSVSDQSDNENELLNSSGDTQHRYNSNNTPPGLNNNGNKPYKARSNLQDLNQRSETFNPSDRKRNFNPKDILQQLKAINSTEIPKPGTYTSVSKREYCREWLKYRELSGFEQDQKLFNFLASKLKPSRALESREYLKNLVSTHSYQLSYMWRESGKNKEIFYKEFSDWLDGPPIKLPAWRPMDIQPTSNIPDELVRINIETNADAFKFLKNLAPPFKADGLIKLVPCTDVTPEQEAKLNDFCARYVADMKFKWLTSNNNEGIFFKKFECWLKLNIKWPIFLKGVLPIPKQTGHETVENEETGKDISKIIHRVIHHPEDAALIAGVLSDHRECSCYRQVAGKKIPDKDTVKKFKPPSQAQKEVLKMAVERLKDSMPAPKDPLNAENAPKSPIHKKHATPAKAHKVMLNQIIYRMKVANQPVANPMPIRKEVYQAEMISKVNNPIVIDDEDDEIDIYRANQEGDKFVKNSLFKLKVVSPANINKKIIQPTVCLNTLISTIEDNLHNSNKEVIVDTPRDNNNTIDNDDNFESPPEQTNENNPENLEFGPVLDKLIFTQPMNLKNGTRIRLPENKEAVICKVSNCSATVLVPKFIKKSGPNVRVRESNYKIKKLVKRVTQLSNYKKNTASSKTSTEKQTTSNINHGILQDSPMRSKESLVQMQTVSRKVSVSGINKRKYEIIASVRSSPSSVQ